MKQIFYTFEYSDVEIPSRCFILPVCDSGKFTSQRLMKIGSDYLKNLGWKGKIISATSASEEYPSFVFQELGNKTDFPREMSIFKYIVRLNHKYLPPIIRNFEWQNFDPIDLNELSWFDFVRSSVVKENEEEYVLTEFRLVSESKAVEDRLVWVLASSVEDIKEEMWIVATQKPDGKVFSILGEMTDPDSPYDIRNFEQCPFDSFKITKEK